MLSPELELGLCLNTGALNEREPDTVPDNRTLPWPEVTPSR